MYLAGRRSAERQPAIQPLSPLVAPAAAPGPDPEQFRGCGNRIAEAAPAGRLVGDRRGRLAVLDAPRAAAAGGGGHDGQMHARRVAGKARVDQPPVVAGRDHSLDMVAVPESLHMVNGRTSPVIASHANGGSYHSEGESTSDGGLYMSLPWRMYNWND